MRTVAAFTIIELLVVIAIIALIVTISVPAFGSMIASANRSMAENSLRASLLTARNLAIQSARGGDAAAVFMFEPGGKLSIIPAIEIASIDDLEGVGSGTPPGSGGTSPEARVRRSIFIPAGDATVAVLPRFWAVRGYAPPGAMREVTRADSITASWYNSDLYGGRIIASPAKDEGNWVFPETGLFNSKQQARLPSRGSTVRQSFMVRFEAGSGRLSLDTTTGVLIAPRASDTRGQDIPQSNKPGDQNFWKRVDQAVDLQRWVNRVMLEPDADGNGQPFGGVGNGAVMGNGDLMARADLLGSRSNDTVLVRAVGRVALYDMRRLGKGIGARGLNVSTQSIYKPYDEATDRIEIDTALFSAAGPTLDQIRVNINHWIIGDTNRDNATDTTVGDGQFIFDPDDQDSDEPEAMLFVVSPYTGQVQEIQR